MVAYNYYLGPCQWDKSDASDPYWRAPVGTVGWVDLASIPQLTRKPGFDREVGFFACNALLPSEFTLIGQGDCRELKGSAAIASAWKAATGYSPMAAGTLADMLADHLMNGGDPKGLNTCFPLVPTADRQIEIHLGGHSVVWQKRFVWDNQRHCNNLKALLQDGLVQCRVDSQSGKRGLHGPDHDFHRRIMQGMLEKYQITFDDIRPNGWPKDETPLPHQTTITDNFNRANQAQLGTSSEGWSWSALSGELDIVSNTAQVITTPGVYRADSDLSSSDHYSQADTIARSALSSQGTAVVTRKDSSSTLTYYFGRLQGTGSDVVRLFKSIANVATQLGSDGAVTVSLPQSIKQTCNGSTISVDYAGVNKISLTDTSITTNTRTGLRIADNSVAASMDNFQASDLSVAGVLYTQLERSTRGLGRGMYQHF